MISFLKLNKTAFNVKEYVFSADEQDRMKRKEERERDKSQDNVGIMK